jgi:syntaxin 18
LAAEQPAGRVGRLLGIPLVTSTPASDQLKAHRASIVLYLTNALAAVGHAQQAQQEARVARHMERTGGGAGGLGGLGSLGADAIGAARGEVHLSERKAGKQPEVPALYVPSPLPAGADDDDDDEPAIDDLLSPEQVQQFEAEASSLLRATQDQLAALRTAETSLLEIGALQSELAHHLTQQAELTDQLWEDATTVTSRVDEGNKQLKRARERNRESRLYLLVFLVGASLTLLFLDRY